MAQPLNRCAVAFSVSCEQWKSPALLHAKRELLPRGLWLQGHVMVFTSYQSTHPAQVGCFSTLSGHIGFLQKHLVRQQLSGLSVVEDWDPSPQNRKDVTSASPSTLQFCWASTCALLRTGGTLFGIHRVSDTETPDHSLSGLDGL